MDLFEEISLPISTDERGWVAWPIDHDSLSQGAIAGLHLPLLKPGATRGNHYHRLAAEYVMICAGPCRMALVGIDSQQRWETVLPGGRPRLFKIAARVAHAFRNEGPHDILLLCYTDLRLDADAADVVRHIVLPPPTAP